MYPVGVCFGKLNVLVPTDNAHDCPGRRLAETIFVCLRNKNVTYHFFPTAILAFSQIKHTEIEAFGNS